MISLLLCIAWAAIFVWWAYLLRNHPALSGAWGLTRQLAQGILKVAHKKGGAMRERLFSESARAELEELTKLAEGAKRDLLYRHTPPPEYQRSDGMNSPGFRIAAFEGNSFLGQATIYNNLTGEQVMNSKILYRVTIIDRRAARISPLGAAKEFLVAADSPEAARTIVLIDQGYTVESLEGLHVDSREVARVPLLPASDKAAENE